MRENVKCVYVLCVCVYKRTDYIFEKNYFRVEKGGRCKSKEEEKKAHRKRTKTNKNEKERNQQKRKKRKSHTAIYDVIFFLRGGCVRVCKCVRE